MHYSPVCTILPPSPPTTSITVFLTRILASQPQKLTNYLFTLSYPLFLPLFLPILHPNNDITCLILLTLPYIATTYIRNPNKLHILYIIFSSSPSHTLPIPTAIIPPHIASTYALTPLAHDTHNTYTSLLVCLTPFLAPTTLLPPPFFFVNTLPTDLSSTFSALHIIPLPMP